MLAALLAQPAAAQVLAAADMRPSLSLDGAWHWSVDPFRDGMAGFHGGPPGPSTRRYADIDVADTEAKDPTALFEFDLQRSPVAHLPGSWIGHAPEMRYYNGLVWYQRSITLPARWRSTAKRFFLRFGAADYAASVWMNGKKLGEHRGGFTPFAFEVTDVLRGGDNQITVGVDSTRTPDDVPPPVTDWENYGGITRSVTLIGVPETYVDDAWVRLTRDGRIAATVHLDGPAREQPVTVRIPALGFALTGKADADGNWTGTVAAPKGLQRWSPETPKLYDVEIAAGEDLLRDRIGFRTVEVRGADILLNGKPIFLRGISVHGEELGANPVRDISPAAARALLSEVKVGLHGNFVRLAHYPHPETMTRMADELGLLVWSEVPVYWLVNWENPRTLADARNMVREEIQRDRNRASIILWSVANETPVSDARNAFLRTLIGDVRRLDDSRLVTAALLADRKGMVQTIADPLAADLDVMAVNSYNGWYTPDALADVPNIEWRSPPGVTKPLVFSEFGAEALAGNHDLGATPHKFSEEYQAAYYRATLAMAAKVPNLRGMSPWLLKDFRSPRRQHPVWQQGWNRKGLISETGQRKAAFFVLAEAYQAREGAK
ncbi:glycoside hydrolase family 2 TIM barrel-domain containing protein [Sphingomonas sp.]|uniref:glycoside hydrolase family 2 protein n=1 Tax=Sphingomonas sp. TaxID=28214 RepID=UPI0026014965|nr:glycoside hydrolase family 2 TIM barrel-domain containing protein [Sphingomonas sp.]